MGSNREQDPTPTASAAESANQARLEPVDALLGRYRLERELGCGAMGVVHAAFDPDLERVIALKVLRSATAPRDAKDRLLREARAMARLAHPNVVSVYEVGTDAGRDFVAMELIDGDTLGSWLRSSRRPIAAILDAFVAAGRGLAAAHAAGIVHRDFKPSNVLRGRDGRIVVTDFGLAREAQGGPGESDLAESLGGGDASSAVSAPAPLTASGVLLGTPPYMAPEQWNRGSITAATDQFAYCVALWEALAGQLPYRGRTRAELRDQIARGPATLDSSRIPRGLRALLRRGLQPVPGQRWPSMDAVLARLERVRRGPGAAAVLAAAGAVVVALVGLQFAVRGGPAPAAAGCGLGGRDLATVWSPSIAARLGSGVSASSVAALSATFRDWEAARETACSAPPKVRPEQLLCLDGVLDRFETLRKAHARVPDDAVEALRAQMVDPAVCLKPAAADVPRFTVAATPQLIAAYALLARSETEHKPSEGEITAQLDASATDPCARVVLTLAFSAASNDAMRAHSLVIDAAGAVEQCGDMRLYADLKILDIRYHGEWPIGGRNAEDAITQAQGAAVRVMQPELAAALAGERRNLARQRRQWDEAFRQSDIELEAYRDRGPQVRRLRAAIARNELRLVRSEPSDLDGIVADTPGWRAIAAANRADALVAQLDRQVAEAGFWLGDPAAAAAWSRSWGQEPHADPGSTREVHGIVVDQRGLPIAGAKVAAANLLRAASFDIGSPLSDIEGGRHIAISDDAGRFAIDAPLHTGAIVAQRDDKRSRPAAIADQLRLVLEPTRSVTGTVELHDTPYTQLSVRCVDADDRTGRFRIMAPIRPDGSFVVEGATTGALRVGIATKADIGIGGQVELQTLPASRASISGLRFALPRSTRTVDVVVRSAVATRLEGAPVVVVPGTHRFRNFGDIIRSPTSSRLDQFASPVLGTGDVRLAADRSRAGYFTAHLEHVAPGDITVCALGFSGDLIYPQVRTRMQDHVTELTLRCEHIGSDTDEVQIAVPPQRRFDS